jgi:hypothetical protein
MAAVSDDRLWPDPDPQNFILMLSVHYGIIHVAMGRYRDPHNQNHQFSLG